MSDAFVQPYSSPGNPTLSRLSNIKRLNRDTDFRTTRECSSSWKCSVTAGLSVGPAVVLSTGRDGSSTWRMRARPPSPRARAVSELAQPTPLRHPPHRLSCRGSDRGIHAQACGHAPGFARDPAVKPRGDNGASSPTPAMFHLIGNRGRRNAAPACHPRALLPIAFPFGTQRLRDLFARAASPSHARPFPRLDRFLNCRSPPPLPLPSPTAGPPFPDRRSAPPTPALSPTAALSSTDAPLSQRRSAPPPPPRSPRCRAGALPACLTPAHGFPPWHFFP
jgi:hypothetical protein